MVTDKLLRASTYQSSCLRHSILVQHFQSIPLNVYELPEQCKRDFDWLSLEMPMIHLYIVHILKDLMNLCAFYCNNQH